MDADIQAALARLNTMSDRPLPEQRDAITEELCALTQSTISYFAAMNHDETILTMIGWSKTAMGMCSVSKKPIVYRLEETGLWGDAVRERKPVITNDYPKLVKPTKKGYPSGHVMVLRHMNLPIFEQNRIVLVVGVGNKPNNYTEADVEVIQGFMNEAWRSFKQTLWETTW